MHNYVRPEVQYCADVVGDSHELARSPSRCDAPVRQDAERSNACFSDPLEIRFPRFRARADTLVSTHYDTRTDIFPTIGGRYRSTFQAPRILTPSDDLPFEIDEVPDEMFTVYAHHVATEIVRTHVKPSTCHEEPVQSPLSYGEVPPDPTDQSESRSVE
ncbi:MAG: hypothetical protein ABFC89_08800 [Methanospirillum sp.]